jgi:hypothetical protein
MDLQVLVALIGSGGIWNIGKNLQVITQLHTATAMALAQGDTSPSCILMISG